MTLLVLSRKCTVSVLSRLVTQTRHSSFPFQTLLFSSSSAKVSVPTMELLTTQHHISPETALKASSTISHLKFPHRADIILSCLKETGFSAPQIDLMISKNPRILTVRPEMLNEKLRVFHDKGFSTLDTIQIISNNPWLLLRSSVNRLVPSIDALRSALGSTDTVCGVLKKLARFLDMDLSKTMIPNMEILMNHSKLSSSQLTEYMIIKPGFFLNRPEVMAESVIRVDKLGLVWTSKMYLQAVQTLCWLSDEELKLKMRFFQGLGLSENEVLQMFGRCPSVFAFAEKNLKEKIEVLLGSGRADPSLFITAPESLKFSLEKRIKPRLEVVKILEEKGLLSLSRKLCLSTILLATDNKFLERFVLSNSKALGDDCVIGLTKKLALRSDI